MNKGFTLIEVLVATAIIGVLASIVLISAKYKNAHEECEKFADMTLEKALKESSVKCLKYLNIEGSQN